MPTTARRRHLARHREERMRYIVTYQRVPIGLPDGRATTDSFAVIDTGSPTHHRVSAHATRQEALFAAGALNAR